MRRLHVFELCDQPWLPRVVRDACTAYLEHLSRWAGHPRRLVPLAERMLDRAPAGIVDLCSGGGGPVVALREALAERGRQVRVMLTDLYPNRAAFEEVRAVKPEWVEPITDPIDARRVPGDLRGARTLFNALHHFEPQDARALLGDAARQGQPLLVFEANRRHPAALLGMLLVVPWVVLATVPLLRPLDWRWLLLTYLIPVLPLVIVWDGLVSVLRTYTAGELRALTEAIDAPSYAWEIGDLDLGAPLPGQYLLGLPMEDAERP